MAVPSSVGITSKRFEQEHFATSTEICNKKLLDGLLGYKWLFKINHPHTSRSNGLSVSREFCIYRLENRWWWSTPNSLQCYLPVNVSPMCRRWNIFPSTHFVGKMKNDFGPVEKLKTRVHLKPFCEIVKLQQN